MSIESVMPSNHLILCRPLLLLPSIFPSIRVFSNGSALRIRRPKYWSFSFCISPSNEYPGLISFRVDWLDLLAVQGTLKRFPWLGQKSGMAHGETAILNLHWGHLQRLRLHASELWCWKRLLRVLWTARSSNQSIRKEVNPEYSLEELMLKLKLQYFGHLM